MLSRWERDPARGETDNLRECLYRDMGRLSGRAAALTLAGLFAFAVPGTATATTTTTAAAVCWPAQPPGGYERLPTQYWSCGQCDEAGAAGVTRGDWRAYFCRTVPVGIDFVHHLYVRR